MSHPTILVIPGSYYQLDVIRAAKRRGFHVITADNRPDNAGHAEADESHTIDVRDVQGILALARQSAICGIVTTCSDISLPAAALAASELGLPGPPAAAVATLLDKATFRAHMIAVGERQPAVFSAEAGMVDPARGNRPPLMVKPTDSSGSKGCRIVMPDDDIAAAIIEAQQTSFTNTAVIEEFIPGPQATCEGFLHNGTAVFAAVTARQTARPPFVATAGHIVPSGLGPATEQRVLAACLRVLDRLGYRSGPFDADLVCPDDGEPVILEITPRLGGNSLTRLMQYAFDFDLADALLSYATGSGHPDASPLKAPRPTAIAVLGVAGDGVLNYDAAALARLNDMPGVRNVAFDLASGSKVRAFHDGRARIGELIVQGVSPTDLKAHFTGAMAEIDKVLVTSGLRLAWAGEEEAEAS